MKITDGIYKIELSRKELVALCRGLQELDTLRTQYPEANNGYDVNTSLEVSKIYAQFSQFGSQ